MNGNGLETLYNGTLNPPPDIHIHSPTPADSWPVWDENIFVSFIAGDFDSIAHALQFRYDPTARAERESGRPCVCVCMLSFMHQQKLFCMNGGFLIEIT